MLDLVMWCKNGGYCLDRVLVRINTIIPPEIVHRRILIDDHSVDETAAIAELWDWEVIPNQGHGIGDGANTALNNVDCDYFISFEHDLVLAEDWFAKIPLHILNNERVAAAQGIRLPDHSLLRKLQEYKIQRIQNDGRLTHSIDNTIYRTDIIRGIGGFPNLRGMGVDSVLVQKVLKAGYQWITDFNVVSIHLRKGIIQEIKHYYKYGLAAPLVALHDPAINLRRMVLTWCFSVFRGVQIAITKRNVLLAVLYPIIRLVILCGYIRGLKRSIDVGDSR